MDVFGPKLSCCPRINRIVFSGLAFTFSEPFVVKACVKSFECVLIFSFVQQLYE